MLALKKNYKPYKTTTPILQGNGFYTEHKKALLPPKIALLRALNKLKRLHLSKSFCSMFNKHGSGLTRLRGDLKRIELTETHLLLLKDLKNFFKLKNIYIEGITNESTI